MLSPGPRIRCVFLQSQISNAPAPPEHQRVEIFITVISLDFVSFWTITKHIEKTHV